MITTLSGEFTEFTAAYSHSDELGGAVTSLLDGINTHFLIRDVLVNEPGRDAVRDFLADDGDAIRVYESDNIDTEVTDQFGTRTLSKFRERLICTPAVQGREYCGDGIRNLDEQFQPVLDTLVGLLPQTDRAFLMLGDRLEMRE